MVLFQVLLFFVFSLPLVEVVVVIVAPLFMEIFPQKS